MPPTPPSCVCGACRRCQMRMAQRRYRASEKGRISHRKYRQSARGKLVVAAINHRRVYLGDQYRGYAPTVAAAEQIRGYIKERIREFKQRQS